MTTPTLNQTGPTDRWLRRTGYATIATMVPYLALKSLWLAGVDLGFREPGIGGFALLLVAQTLAGALVGTTGAIHLAEWWAGWPTTPGPDGRDDAGTTVRGCQVPDQPSPALPAQPSPPATVPASPVPAGTPATARP